MKDERIWFDCEFTGLHQKTTLISLGLISETGSTFYCEFTDYCKSQVNEWIRSNVIDNLKFNGEPDSFVRADSSNIEMKGNKSTVKTWLIKWLNQFKKIQFVADVCHYDFVLLIDLLSDDALSLDNRINPFCHDINQDIAKYLKITDREAFNMSREDILKMYNCKEEGIKHNSLYDAKVARRISSIVERGNK